MRKEPKIKKYESTKTESKKFNSKKSFNEGPQKQRRIIDEATKNLRRLYNKLMQKETTKSKKQKNYESKTALIDKIISNVGNSWGNTATNTTHVEFFKAALNSQVRKD